MPDGKIDGLRGTNGGKETNSENMVPIQVGEGQWLGLIKQEYREQQQIEDEFCSASAAKVKLYNILYLHFNSYFNKHKTF